MSGELPNQTRISLRSQPRYVYALIDPRDDTVRYIGMTKNLYSRLEHHVKYTSRADGVKAWVTELEQQGLYPELEILETIEARPDVDAVALEREKHWIREFLKSGVPLLNVSGVSRACPPQRAVFRNSTQLIPFAEARVRTGLTIAQVCAEANVSRPIIEKIERGKPVSAPLAARACRVLSRYLDQPVTYQSLGIKTIENRRRKR